jgi:ribosomal protein S18 acetylase RimI-like enzyme
MPARADDLIVRGALSADDTALLGLERVGWTPGSGFPSVDHHRQTRFFTERRTPASFLVAVLGGRLVGFAAVRAKSPFPEAAHVQAVWSLVVAPDRRRQGIASALLAGAERLARSRGARKISLHVLGSNTAALSLYEGNGYTVEGRYRDEFLIDGTYVDDITLTKTL